MLGRLPMPLNLIHGPPNSGRAGLIRRRFAAALERDPVLVVPDRRRRLRLRARALRGGRGAGRRGDDLRRRSSATVATAAGAPPGAELTAGAAAAGDRGRGRAPRRAARAAAALGRAARLRPSPSSGCSTSCRRPGSSPAAVEAERRDAGGLRLPRATSPPSSPATPRCASARGRVDAHGIAREAIALLRRDRRLLGRAAGLPLRPRRPHAATSSSWSRRWRRVTEVTVALPYEEGNAALAARARLLGRAARADRRRRGDRDRGRPGEHRRARCSSTSRAASARPAPTPAAAGRRPAPAALGRACAARRRRSRAEVVEAARRRRRPGRDRDRPARPGAARARRSPRRSRPTGSPTALEAELPVAGTAVGGALLALLEAEFGARRAERPAALPARPLGLLPRPGRLARAGAAARPGRRTPETALALWQGEDGEPPRDLVRLREAAARSAGRARRRGRPRWPRRWPRGRCAARATGRALGPRRRARAARGGRRSPTRSPSWPSWASWRPGPAELAATIAALEFRVWSGPVEGRVRIASPYRLRAGRFDHVFVASLQDGEFPRRDRGGDPFLSEAQRDRARARPAPRHRGRGALPLRRLPLAAAPAPLPLLPRQRRERRRRGALAAARRGAARCSRRAPDGDRPDPVEEAITRGRDLARGRPPAGRGALGGRAGARARRARAAAPTPAALLARGRGRAASSAARLERRIAAARARRGRLARARAAGQPGGDRVARRGRRLRRHDAGGLRRLLLPLVRRPRARPAAARPGRPTRSSRAG